ncbi:hypothetical protein SAMN05446935_6471 [Burkholderia sp. YR290]|jgi:hypothetical protein|nr:hypothetical protein SAMN05446934_5125 [Paraburkholderia hospita]SOE85983.1 hypothetical protein SAMN05446935_6471 [Burkholderia sp. YR290]
MHDAAIDMRITSNDGRHDARRERGYPVRVSQRGTRYMLRQQHIVEALPPLIARSPDSPSHIRFYLPVMTHPGTSEFTRISISAAAIC